jgi:branched-chain amino acid transport system substrate-binding protein
MAAFVTACSDRSTLAPVPARVVALGVVQSMTGSAGTYGKSIVEGVELAVRQINADSARTSIRLAYTLVDDGSSVAQSKAAFNDFVSKKADVIIGPTLSSLAIEDHPIAQAGKIPVLGATTTAAGITDVGNYVFRIALSEDMVVPSTLARVARLTPLRQAVLILDGNDAFSRSSAAAMRTGLAAQGGTIRNEIDVATANLGVELDRLTGKTFDAFLVTPLFETSATVLMAIRAAGFQHLVVGGNGFNTLDIARLAGPAVEGAYVGAAWNKGSTAAASVTFVAAFVAAYGHPPDQFAAQGYSSVFVVLDAIKRSSAQGTPSLRDALAATQNLTTPLGVLSISERREAVHLPVVQQYRNGQLIVVP